MNTCLANNISPDNICYFLKYMANNIFPDIINFRMPVAVGQRVLLAQANQNAYPTTCTIQSLPEHEYILKCKRLRQPHVQLQARHTCNLQCNHVRKYPTPHTRAIQYNLATMPPSQGTICKPVQLLTPVKTTCVRAYIKINLLPAAQEAPNGFCRWGYIYLIEKRP